MALADSDRLAAFRTRPGSETLRALLEECRGRVYNVCVQVLRDAHRAEDAAQEALFKIAEGVTTATDLRHFTPWMYRVAFNTAVNLLKKDRSRRASEDRWAREVPSAVPPEEAREAVQAALAQLDDEARHLIILHFFEQRTLEDIAREQKVSIVAVWKRIDRAKEFLKRSLERSGRGAFAAFVDSVLHSSQPSVAPAQLVSQTLFQRSPDFLAPAAPGTAAAFGGAAMTGKGVSLATAAAVSVILFFMGVGGGYLVKSSSSLHGQALSDPTLNSRAQILDSIRES